MASSPGQGLYPNAKVYLNEYGIEDGIWKLDCIIGLLEWLRSEGATVRGLGMQWHIDVTTVVQEGDKHYLGAQKVVDKVFEFTVSELDVGIPVSGAVPENPADIQRQGASLMLTAGFLISVTSREL